jgi:hypothetical protein
VLLKNDLAGNDLAGNDPDSANAAVIHRIHGINPQLFIIKLLLVDALLVDLNKRYLMGLAVLNCTRNNIVRGSTRTTTSGGNYCVAAAPLRSAI